MSSSSHPGDEFTGDTTTEEVTRTIVVGLESSQRKNARVEQAIGEYQSMTEYMAAVLPSYPPSRWHPRSTQMYRQITREFPEDDRLVKATVAREAQQQVAEAFGAWETRGRPGNRPVFGDANYLRLSHQDFDVVRNDRGWGLKASFIPYDPVWFRMRDGIFQRQFLERVTDPEDDASTGSGELRLDGDGSLTCHLTISWPVEVYEPADVTTAVGVDLNDDPVAVAAVVDEGEDVVDVELESGSEFRHYREQLKRRRETAMANDDLRSVTAREDLRRYTDYITNVASRRVVDLAVEHAPAVIYLEDLTHYRETAKEPIHDWPFAEIQDKIAYKATEEGIPVEFVDPRNTSITCRKCGVVDGNARDGRDFYCSACGYEIHADVNAAINIALAGGDSQGDVI